jgi:hypothetical protein
MPSRSAALAVVDLVEIGFSDLAGCLPCLTLGRAGSISVALPQPSEPTLDCASISGTGRVAQLVSKAQNTETITRRIDTRTPLPAG